MLLLEKVLGIAIPLTAFFLMTVVGMDLRPDRIRDVRRKPKALITGLLGQIVLPALAAVLARAMHLSPEIESGVLLMAAAPAGGISNYYNYLAGANVALSVTLTTFSCLAAAVTMPVIFTLFQSLLGFEAGFTVPLSTLFVQTFLMLMTPVLLGILIRYKKPFWVESHSKTVRKISFALLAALVVFVIYQTGKLFFRDLSSIFVSSCCLIVLSYAAGYGLARTARLNFTDSFTIGIEFSVRNIAVAVAVAVTTLKRPEFAIFGTAYFLTEVPIMMLAIFGFRKLTAMQRRASTQDALVS